jgi:hypothetical protein
VTLRRFADSYTAGVGRLRGGSPSLLRIPTDAADDPWWAEVASSKPVRVCNP